MGGRGAYIEKRFNDIKRKYDYVSKKYKEYARILNYSNKKEYRDEFDYWGNERRRLMEEYSKYNDKIEKKEKKERMKKAESEDGIPLF